MGAPKTQTVTQKTEIDPIKKSFLFGTPLPSDYRNMMEDRNRRIMGLDPIDRSVATGSSMGMGMVNPADYKDSPMEERRQEAAIQSHIDSVNQNRRDRDIVESGGFGYNSGTGQEMQPGGRDLSMRSGGMYAQGGIIGLANGGMVPMMNGGLPNLSDQDTAYRMALMTMQPRGYAAGGRIQGPGTPTSDSIPATIYQDGRPVDQARLSTEEVVLSHRDLANMDPDGNYRRASAAIGNAPNGERGRKAAEMYAMTQMFRNGGGVR